MNLNQLFLAALSWAIAHPYAAFVILLLAFILYAKFIFPREVKR